MGGRAGEGEVGLQRTALDRVRQKSAGTVETSVNVLNRGLFDNANQIVAFTDWPFFVHASSLILRHCKYVPFVLRPTV